MAGERRARGRQAALDPGRRGRLRRLGRDLPRRRPPRRLAAVRARAGVPARPHAPGGPGLRRRDARDLRVPVGPIEPVVAAEPLPRVHRRLPRAPRDGDRGLRRRAQGRSRVRRALPPPPHDLPARLPGRLRLRDAAQRRTRRAHAPRARRPAAGDRGRARRPGSAARSGDHHRAAGPPASLRRASRGAQNASAATRVRSDLRAPPGHALLPRGDRGGPSSKEDTCSACIRHADRCSSRCSR